MMLFIRVISQNTMEICAQTIPAKLRSIEKEKGSVPSLRKDEVLRSCVQFVRFEKERQNQLQLGHLPLFY